MRLVVAAALSSLVAGCTLLVSTSGFDDGKPDAGATPPPRDSGASTSGDAMTTSDSGRADADADASYRELPGLIGAWLFEDGTANDSSGHAHDGALEGDAVVAETNRGKAMRLSGAGRMHVDTLFNGAFPATGTISLWFQWATMAVANQTGFFDAWDDSRDHVFVRHANGDPVGRIQIAFQRPSTYELVTTFDLANNTWTHVVVTWDAVAHFARVFVDNAKVTSGIYPDGAFTPSGQHCVFGDTVDGFIDDIRLYDRALSEAEIVTVP
jgi:hypothetical protein